MPIIVKEIENHEHFNEFVENHPLGTIHQRYEWGEFQAKYAKRDKYWAIYLEENDKIKTNQY